MTEVMTTHYKYIRTYLRHVISNLTLTYLDYFTLVPYIHPGGGDRSYPLSKQ